METLQYETTVVSKTTIESIFHTDNISSVNKENSVSIPHKEVIGKSVRRESITIYMDNEEIDDGLSSDDDSTDTAPKKGNKYRERYHAMVKYVRKVQKEHIEETRRLKVSKDGREEKKTRKKEKSRAFWLS
jgi:hypothetical protein